jgi:hypothetical protein
MRTLMKVGFSLLLLAFLLIGLSYSMLKAQGTNGSISAVGRNLESEMREVDGDVGVIDLDGPIDLTVRQGATASLQVKGEQRLLGNIATTVNGDTLHIGTTGMLLHHRQPLQVMLVLPSLREVHVRGSGDGSINGFSGDEVTVTMEGSGAMKFNGRFRDVHATVRGSGELEMNGGASDDVVATIEGSGRLTVVGSAKSMKGVLAGSGDLDGRHLKAETVELTMLGSGSAVVNATSRFDTTVRGTGDVAVYGKPDKRAVNINGTGDVSYKE